METNDLLDGDKFIAVTKPSGELIALLNPETAEIVTNGACHVIVSYTQEPELKEDNGVCYLANDIEPTGEEQE